MTESYPKCVIKGLHCIMFKKRVDPNYMSVFKGEALFFSKGHKSGNIFRNSPGN